MSCDDFDFMELAEACSGTDDPEAGSGIPADFRAACVYLGSDSADPYTPRCQAIAVAAKCRAADLRCKIDIVNRRLVRREANVGRCDRAVACLESELAAAPAAPAVAVSVECGGGSASSGGGAIGSSVANAEETGRIQERRP